jgi:hypothetical protein
MSCRVSRILLRIEVAIDQLNWVTATRQNPPKLEFASRQIRKTIRTYYNARYVSWGSRTQSGDSVRSTSLPMCSYTYPGIIRRGIRNGVPKFMEVG